MITIRYIERLWNAGSFQQLLRELLNGRPEGASTLAAEWNGAVPAAAMIMIRLDELTQSHVPLYGRLVRFVLAAQEGDGGWGDPALTALCLRALLAGRGQGAAIQRGMGYLASLQKDEGIWPKVPLRRMPADAITSALVLLQLGGDEMFRNAVDLDRALDWFDRNEQELDQPTLRLWSHAKLRCLAGRVAPSAQAVLSWS